MQEQIKPGKVVVVHRGARDAYQVARAMREAGMLERLVTDVYCGEGSLPQALGRVLPVGVQNGLRGRSVAGVPGSSVRTCAVSGLLALAFEKLQMVPFSWRRSATRWCDHELGRTAGRLATRRQAGLLSYSYYGYSGFGSFRSEKPAILFQLHPHPASVRRLLLEELEAHPDCAESIGKEWELALPDEDYARLVEETRMARHWLAASTFTRRTLEEDGIPPEDIQVIPYGVDLDRFHDAPGLTGTSGPLKLLFVGTINQRKGIKYLLEALRLLPGRQVELTVCGRAVDDLRLFRPFVSQVRVRPSVSHAELVHAYRSSDLFVFPSIAEGFGHVLLESLACGLPVLSTTHTAAPDLLTEGEDGWVVSPRRPDLLAERIAWALDHRAELQEMKTAARRKAEHFTWNQFRQGVVRAVARCFEEPGAEPSPACGASPKAAHHV